jgi:hypothetical protein
MNKDRESTGHAEKLYILYVHDGPEGSFFIE